MESENSKTFSINANLEIKIKDFQTASKSFRKGEYVEHPDGNFTIWFSALASPSGFDKDTEGWLVVRPYVTVLRGKYRPQDSALSWIVSVIDTEGETRFPRSFMQNLSEDITDAKYLQRSFILNRADEFLPEGELILRCDICFQWYANTTTSAPLSHSKIERRIIQYVPRSDQEPVKNDPQDPMEDYAAFVEKNKILTEVFYLAELGKFSAVYDPPSVKEKHPKVWRFDTRNESFNMILDEQRNNVGARLLKTSPVIRQCVNSPMKEQRDKRIELPNVDSQTFKHVAYFLKNETLPKFEFDKLLEIYKFSHLYEMEALQRNCAEDMANCLEVESDFVELQKIADFYCDEYLSKLLHSHRHEYENLERNIPHVRMVDGHYSGCYS